MNNNNNNNINNFCQKKEGKEIFIFIYLYLYLNKILYQKKNKKIKQRNVESR